MFNIEKLHKKQEMIDGGYHCYHQKEVVFMNKGRHDPCVVSRAVPIVESMAAIVLMDMYLLNLSSK